VLRRVFIDNLKPFLTKPFFMANPLSLDLRSRIVEAYQAGAGGYRKLAERFEVSVCSVRRFVALNRNKGSLEPIPHTAGPPKKIRDCDLPDLKALLAEKPDRTAAELAQEWKNKYNVLVHRSTMSRILVNMRVTYKKNLPSCGARPC
jgi:transposase